MKDRRIVGLVLTLPLLSGCATSEATSAVLVNRYPATADAAASSASVTVYKGWWSVAEFAVPVVAGADSAPVRVVPGTDYGYALLAMGWDSEAGAPPSTLVPVRSTQPLSVARGDTLSFVVSDAATVGNCAAGNPLSQQDADFITQRIFPGEFALLSYHAATCTTSVAADDGGSASAGGGAAASDGDR